MTKSCIQNKQGRKQTTCHYIQEKSLCEKYRDENTLIQVKGLKHHIEHTKFNSPKPSDYPDTNFLQMPDGLTHSDVSSKNFISLMLAFNFNCITPLQESMTHSVVQMMKKEDHHEKIGCIIDDKYMYCYI
ncbi:hypothetical protein L484_006027 [Morus notabilis]|uniref:Uncharacterized protein n=1 Tax=Morus notabilis TaxID=981085 RepID=W9QZU7_9ROSA|nr:hypothetical protein L484_006027 [Morus notabilis]